MFKGINTPVITIFDETGNIDFPAMKKHIEHLVQAGINGLLLFGSMGEFYAISELEKRELVKQVVAWVNHRAKVIVGIGSTRKQDVLNFGQYCIEVGVDAVNIISPYYFGPSDKAAEIYFSELAENLNIPIMLYNFKDRTGSDLTPGTIYNLALKYKNIVGVKDTVDNISHTRKICQKIKSERPDFEVLSGFDEYYLVNRISGGDGVLCGLTNVVPEIFVEMHQAYEIGNLNVVMEKARLVSNLMKLYDVTDLFVVGMKEAVRLMGLPMSTFTHAPGQEITAHESEQVAKILKDNNLL